VPINKLVIPSEVEGSCVSQDASPLNLTHAKPTGAPSFRVLCGKVGDDNLDERTLEGLSTEGRGIAPVQLWKATTSVVPISGKSPALAPEAGGLKPQRGHESL
jgi:hypothetical protein